MHILVVHQYYLHAGQPGGSRFNEFARLWSGMGHSVTVIAGTLNYATGEVPERYRGRLVTRERDEKVEVLRCMVPKSYSLGFAGRMWAFFGFTVSSTAATLMTNRPDVVIATSPPLTIAIPGWLAARRRWPSVPWVFEVRDLWPESAVTTGVLRKDGALTRALYKLERWACQSADAINVLTPAFKDDIVHRRLAGSERIVMIPNGADTDIFQPGPKQNELRKELGWADHFVVMYAGAHGRANALHQLIDAAERLKGRPDILIACVGDGPERSKLEEDARRRGLRNIQFCGPQPKDRMPDVVNACDVGAAMLQDNPTFRTVYPNKVFDYMACKRPVLLAIDGVARRLVCDDAKAGVFAKPEDAVDIAAQIEWLADHPEECVAFGERGHDWVHRNMSRRMLAERYIAELEKLMDGSRGQR